MIDENLLSDVFSNNSNITMLDFSYQDFNDHDLELVCSALGPNTHVNTILANATYITDAGVYKLAQVLQKKPHIKRIEIARNHAISDACIDDILSKFKSKFNNVTILHRLSTNPHRNIKKIDEVSSITPECFFEEYVQKNRPVIVREAIKNSLCLLKWSPQYFREKMGDREVNLTVHNLDARWKESYFQLMNRLPMYMFQAVSLIEKPAPKNSLRKRYYIQQERMNNFPEIKKDIELPSFGHAIKNLKVDDFLWFGQKDTYTPLHFDESDNIFIQVYGCKSVFICDPKDSEFLFQQQPKQFSFAPTQLSKIKNVDVADPDTALLKYATPYHSRLSPGDALYLPRGWWHEVRSLFMPSISVNYWFSDDKEERILEIDQLLMGGLQGKQDCEHDKKLILKCVKKLINLNNPNYIISDGLSILHVTVLFNALEAFKLLLSHSLIDLKAITKLNRYSPLFMIIKFGHLEMLNLFLEHKDAVLPSVFEYTGYTPISLAIEEGHTHIIKRLLL